METRDGTLLGPIAGIAFTSDQDYPLVHEFSSLLDFLQFFLRKPYRAHVAYAHKGMSFDIAHLLANADVQRWLLAHDFTVTVDRSFAIIRTHKHAWYLGDSYRIIQERLEKILGAFAPHRTKAPLPSDPFSWDHAGWRQRILEDTLGLYESLKRLEEIVRTTFGIPLSLTMPSTALRAARTMLPQEKIARPPRRALDWLRAGAYSGGRIEVFMQGEIHGHIYCFDINSAYAHAMKGGFPLGAGRYKKGEPRHEFYIGRCELDVPTSESIPPVLSRLFNHAFCVGRFQAMLTSEEVAFARSCGAAVRVIECWTWTKHAPIFKAFIERCETLRKSDYHGPIGKAVKLMQNGLYGILGMNPYRRMQRLALIAPPMPWAHAFDMRHGVYIPNTYEAYIRKESPNQMPHWAAIITARVRIQLTAYLRLCQKIGLRPLYAHTDSIWLAARNGIPPALRALCSDDYGNLKLEAQGDRAIIVAPGEAALHTRDPEHPWKISSKGWRVKDREGHDTTFRIFERGIAATLEQVQTFRAGTALKWRAPGRTITKAVMNYAAMTNRLPADSRPGPTAPKIADAYRYEDYWSFRRWYVGKLRQERPSARVYRLPPVTPPATIEATAHTRNMIREGSRHGKEEQGRRGWTGRSPRPDERQTPRTRK